ncbi:MAG TPA: thiolase family protein [Solirubrobacteraceae bacterium]|nr:thiolase family protein [Solirubrobacteraceae bacterium]
MADAFIYDAVRTPFGRYAGALSGVRPDDLARHVIAALAERGLDPERVDEVIFGDANQAGEDNRNVARMAVLLAAWPTSVPGSTINRLCGSSLDGAMQASRAIETGDMSCVVVGGVESMSRAPRVLLGAETPYARGNQTLHSTTLGWRMVNPAMPERWTISLAASTEKLAAVHRVDRSAQDEFAARSHRLTAQAWDVGFYSDWVIPVPGTDLAEDENVRRDTSIEKLGRLPPAFVADGTVTAGNASPLNDGAAALLIGDGSLPGEPLARIVSRGIHAVDPDIFGIAPVQAADRALAKAGIGWGDVEVVELNEAFAAQSLACLGEWTDLDPERVNPNGGAIAIAHPLGASGARILANLAYELRRRGGGYGVAAICIGVGQGLAVVLHV